jgi:hypothetical protein
VIDAAAHPGFLVYVRHAWLPADVLADLDAETVAIGGLVDLDNGLWFVPASPPKLRDHR